LAEWNNNLQHGLAVQFTAEIEPNKKVVKDFKHYKKLIKKT